eukprot:CAMPEP_0203744456 /NCGR_PEP_ID=MMETSP0098-20131031/509_1 /ASSEMBLY_ACC=CAM_ASM_000208 /TAXON_ID=96639 /ORGANISM=" , Strain NY0313808BC1" /LENGTH=425 /DNA_ID=CAMNT_0050631971 /DNA_START=355 /DNA_END=1632 /DNA_ORIENTATION=+
MGFQEFESSEQGVAALGDLQDEFLELMPDGFLDGLCEPNDAGNDTYVSDGDESVLLSCGGDIEPVQFSTEKGLANGFERLEFEDPFALFPVESDPTVVSLDKNESSLGKRDKTDSSDDLLFLEDKTGDHALNNLEQINFLRLVNDKLRLNDRKDRDWTHLEREYRSLYNWERRLCFKQKAKLVLQERRVRKQQRTYQDLRKVAGEKKKVTKILSRIFSDRSKFEESFVASLAQEMISLMKYNKNSPGSILEWPENARKVVTDKMIELHRDIYNNNKLHLLYADFCDLFSIADIELGIISSCTCESCVRDWELNSVEVSSSAALRLHWSRIKGRRMAQILEAHVDFGNDMYCWLNENDLSLKDWNKTDIDCWLKSAHSSKQCSICSKTKKCRRRCTDKSTDNTKLALVLKTVDYDYCDSDENEEMP